MAYASYIPPVSPPYTESTREFSTPLQDILDTPGVDFVTLDNSMMVEEKSARLPSCRSGRAFSMSYPPCHTLPVAQGHIPGGHL